MAISPQETIRRQNLGALLRYVHLRGATSRAELTAGLGLNRSTIRALATELAAAGLVREEIPPASGRAGRPSPVVRTNSASCYAYALTVQRDHLRAACVGLGGRILDSFTARLSPGTGRTETVAILARLLGRLQAQAPPGGALLGYAVAVSADGPSATELAAALPHDRPLLIGTPADLAARAEHARGAARGLSNIVYLHGDAGISAGILTGGQAVTGHGGFGGQVGHMVVDPVGHRCRCGSRGCWETEAGEPALLRRSASGDALTVLAAARAGDDASRASVRDVARWLGHGVANLVNILDPEVVLFGGVLREVYLAAADEVRARVSGMVLPAFREGVRLGVPLLGEDAPLIGAAELAFESLLNDPLNGV
ncbi:ROK family transcriptional regulator [Actinoplanes sp. NPDC051861]|uniref:ROK family transcriptional regulator n=1 Tax=Actinoplanes sp. NPDC051861 TaxID=3155170 RepID=UPI00343C0BE4